MMRWFDAALDWLTIRLCRHRETLTIQHPDKRYALRCLRCGAVSPGTA